jgi:CheY-like chemotaxis protein
VDDNPAQQGVLRDQFAAWGIPAVIAADGEEALQLLRESAASTTPFRVAIIDRQMPQVDGFDLAMDIRSRHDLRGTALMLVLAAEDQIDPARLHEMGFSGHMTKPIRQSQLFNAIMDCIAVAEQNPARQERPASGPVGLLTPASATEAQGLRILVAEDNEVNQIVVREVLTRLGHSCDIVPDGKEALEALRRGAYDLMLMDCQMPVMDGFEATREIRRRESGGDMAGTGRTRLPIIALTANAMKGDRESCLGAGMDGYVTKPIDPKELVRALDQVSGTAAALSKAA